MAFHYHPPGELSRTAVLDVGLNCPHSCRFCYHSFLGGDADQFRGMRHAAFRDAAGLRQLLTNLRGNGFQAVDVTGGEPTLHPAIVALIAHATELGLASRIITLGQFLTERMRGAERMLIDELLDAGLTNVLFSFHSSDAAEFRSITGESLAKQLAAMDRLGERGFAFCTNTVVIAENLHRIPEIARRLTRTNTYLHNFIIMNSYHPWNDGGKTCGILPRHTRLLSLLEEATATLAAADIACNIRDVPLCGLPGLEQHIVGLTGLRYDPYEWMNRETHTRDLDPVWAAVPWRVEPGATQDEFRLYRVEEARVGHDPIFAVRGTNGAKVLPAICQSCSLLGACDGFDPQYVAQFGAEEACPYDDPATTGVLTTSRCAYVPAFLVKTAPDAPMRAVNRRFLNPPALTGQPTVSVAITTNDHAAAITRALSSALQQTYGQIEAVVVDGGGTDDTIERLDAAGLLDDPRVTLVQLGTSGQPASDRNIGIRAATGALILPLDAGDWIAPTYVAEAVAVLRDNPSVSIAYSDAQYSQLGLVRALEYDFPTLLYANQLSYCSLFKRAVFDDTGGYRDNVHGVEAWDFWIAAGSKGHFGKRIPRPLFHHTESDNAGFAADDAGEVERRFARIILNNSAVYQPDRIRWAEERLAASRHVHAVAAIA